MKSYNLELLKLSGLDFIFKQNIKHPEIPLKTNPDLKIQHLPSNPISTSVSLETLKLKYANCQKCPLHETRTNVVYGDGNPNADIMIIGEGPGAQEDKTGHVFVGPAGQLLTKMLKAINVERQDIYITNIVKCHPPQNRDPFPAERQACLPYLREQINLIKPKIIILLGKVAANTILGQSGVSTLSYYREKEHYFQNITTFVTYHPSALLHNPSYKLPAWHDLQRIQHYLENN
ncbi:uracil-DNA glycosylase [bacterium]|nr:uracil-DNA glycosylase [bacterium]